MISTSVDFPAPEGPAIPSDSFFKILSEKSSMVGSNVPGYWNEILSSLISLKNPVISDKSLD